MSDKQQQIQNLLLVLQESISDLVKLVQQITSLQNSMSNEPDQDTYNSLKDKRNRIYTNLIGAIGHISNEAKQLAELSQNEQSLLVNINPEQLELSKNQVKRLGASYEQFLESTEKLANNTVDFSSPFQELYSNLLTFVCAETNFPQNKAQASQTIETDCAL